MCDRFWFTEGMKALQSQPVCRTQWRHLPAQVRAVRAASHPGAQASSLGHAAAPAQLWNKYLWAQTVTRVGTDTSQGLTVVLRTALLPLWAASAPLPSAISSKHAEILRVQPQNWSDGAPIASCTDKTPHPHGESRIATAWWAAKSSSSFSGGSKPSYMK